MPIQIALDSLKQAASGTANSATFLRGDNAFSSTFSSPVISGTATGTYTLGGTPSIAATALTGTIAAARLPAGSVLQVVQSTTNSSQTMSITTSATLVASGFTCSITPTSASSKILVFYSSTFGSTSGNNGVWGEVQLYRKIGSGSFSTTSALYQNYWNVSSYLTYQQLSFTLTYLDSPATTSAVVYQPYFYGHCGTAGGLAVLGGRNTDGGQNSSSVITAMEIAV